MRTIAIGLLILLLISTGYSQESLRPEGPVALVGGMLLDGYEAEPIHHSIVVFEDGRITAVGTKLDTPIPGDAVVIDTGGRTVMPGLIDAHMHIDLIGHGEYERYYDFLDGMERIDEVMPIAAKQMLRGGVTTRRARYSASASGSSSASEGSAASRALISDAKAMPPPVSA